MGGEISMRRVGEEEDVGENPFLPVDESAVGGRKSSSQQHDSGTEKVVTRSDVLVNGKEKTESSELNEEVVQEEMEEEHIRLVSEGIALDDQNKYEEAILKFSEAISLKGDYAPAYNNRGLAYDELEQHSKAIQDYSKAIELKKDYTDAYSNRGAVFSELQKFPEAIKDFSKAIELKSSDGLLFITRAGIFTLMKKFDEAVTDYSKAIEFNNEDPTLYFQRGILFTKLEKYGDAIQDFERSLELKKDFVMAEKCLKGCLAKINT